MAMSSFHRPRVYRSIGGCCICRAKSSSSRFTTSDKYEHLFKACFRLPSACPRRSGEICNACVLLVKRYQKLPNNSTRHWAHVVDARAGPGVKNFVKVRRRESCRERTLKRKHVFRRQKRESSSISSDEAVLSDHSGSQLTSASALKADSRVSDFIDLSFWKRKEICCGTIFVGPSGEAIVDPQLLRACPRQHRPQPLPELPYSIHTIEAMIATELKMLDRKDRKDVVCPLTPSTTSSDSSSPVPSSSEEGGVEEVTTFTPNNNSSSVIITSATSNNMSSPPNHPIINATANKYLVF